MFTLIYPDGIVGDHETTLEDLAEQFLWANSKVVDDEDDRFAGAVPCVSVGNGADEYTFEPIFDVLGPDELKKWEDLTK